MSDFAISFAYDDKDVLDALAFAPQELAEELSDGMDHYRRKFFKTLKSETQLGKVGAKRAIKWMKWMQSYVNGQRIPQAYKRGKSFVKIERKIDRVRLHVLSHSELLEIHEEGGTITKGSKQLIVPLPAAKTKKTKRTMKKFRKFDADGKYQSLGSNKRIFKARGMLWLKVGGTVKKPDKVVPIFKLVDSVTLKARLGFGKTFRALETWRQQMFARKARTALFKASQKRKGLR